MQSRRLFRSGWRALHGSSKSFKFANIKISRKKVAIYKYKKFAEPVEHKEMDLIVTNGKIKIEVDKKGAVIFLQTSKRSLKVEFAMIL